MSDNRFTSPAEAERAFYDAFQSADLEAMMAVWAQDDDIACIHPMGKILNGRDEVREGWQQLFSGDQRMHFEIDPQHTGTRGEFAVHTVIENIYLHGDSKPRPPIVATNVYRHTAEGWRMVLHHASPSVVDATGKDQQAPEPPRPLH